MTAATLVLAAGLSALPAKAEAPLCREDAHSPGAPRPLPQVSLVPVVAGLDRPVHAAAAGDGSGRLFIVEQAGVIKVLQNGKLRKTPFLDIRDRVKSGDEMGLLSVTFHPRFKRNRKFYVNYTSAKGGLHTVISEFLADETRGAADPAGERVLLTVDQPYRNHNGGQNAFGPDGFLYVGMGDGGSGNDPHDNGQRLDTLLGKMLRIDVDGRGGKRAYRIPPDNPFVKNPKARPEIFAYGLRNPWRFSFDAATGRLYAGDVGQNRREEIDIVEKGKNYGWRVMEGSICTPGVNAKCSPVGEAPIHDYGRKDGISVTGGFVYRGRGVPDLCGVYVFGDFGGAPIWALRYDAGARKASAVARIAEADFSISSFGEDEDRELYVVDYGGRLLRISSYQR